MNRAVVSWKSTWSSVRSSWIGTRPPLSIRLYSSLNCSELEARHRVRSRSRCPVHPADRGGRPGRHHHPQPARSEEHTSELQSLMRISYAVFCLKKKKENKPRTNLK